MPVAGRPRSPISSVPLPTDRPARVEHNGSPCTEAVATSHSALRGSVQATVNVSYYTQETPTAVYHTAVILSKIIKRMERFASSVIQVMVGANGPVRGPHPIRVSGKSVKDDSSPIRGPHPVSPIRVSEQEKEIQGGMVGKEERSAEACCWRSQTSDPWRPALEAKLGAGEKSECHIMKCRTS